MAVEGGVCGAIVAGGTVGFEGFGGFFCRVRSEKRPLEGLV